MNVKNLFKKNKLYPNVKWRNRFLSENKTSAFERKSISNAQPACLSDWLKEQGSKETG